jgi:hypothetical protein
MITIKYKDIKLCAPPKFSLKQTKKSAASKKGLSYERRVFEYLEKRYSTENVSRGVWIEYKEYRSKRTKYAQPDILILIPELALGVVVECKLSYRAAAKRKLRSLYLPLCQVLWPEILTWKTVQVCKNLTPAAKRESDIIYHFDDIIGDHETMMFKI